MMDIGIVTPSIDQYGGAEIYILQCMKRWQYRASLTLYTSSYDRKLFQEFDIDENIKIKKLESGSSEHEYSLLEKIMVLPKTWELQIGPHDVYLLYMIPTHTLNLHPSVVYLPEPLRIVYDLRYTVNPLTGKTQTHIYPLQEYAELESSQREIQLSILEKMDSFVSFDYLATNSEFTKNYLETVYNHDVDAVVYPGIEVKEDIVPISSSNTVITVARLWWYKRIDIIIRSMEYVDEGELIIVGKGPEKDSLIKLVENLGLSKRVSFKENISQEELSLLYEECACGVFIPLFEPFGMVPLEIAAHGRPLVLSRTGGFSEVFDDENAIFTEVTPRALGRSIDKVLKSKELGNIIGRAAYKKSKEYTWDRTAKELFNCLQKAHDDDQIQNQNPPMLGAFYYPWYRTGNKTRHWNENTLFSSVTDEPIQGAYTSYDINTLEYHYKLIKKSGLDFIVINVQIDEKGIHNDDLKTINTIFNNSQIDIKVAFIISLKTDDFEIFIRSIEKLKQFTSHKKYLEKNGSPLLWYFLTDEVIGCFYFHHKEFLNCNKSFLTVASANIYFTNQLPVKLKEFFNGWSFFSPLQISEPERWEKAWKSMYLNCTHQSKEERVLVFNISPGYDDSASTNYKRENSQFRIIPRDGLKTYRLMQAATMDLNPLPDFVVINSFNEFHENTHIEPSITHGDKYIESTKQFKNRITNIYAQRK